MDILQSVVGRSKGKEVNNQHDGGGAGLPAVSAEDGTARAPSKLNPLAKEWFPWQERTPEKDRSLFVTFSNGYPLNDFQIWQFFTILYGECVEKVEVIWPEIRRRGRGRGRGRGPALFGRVVFNNSCLPPFILRNKDHAKFWVNGRPLWCKKFLPH